MIINLLFFYFPYSLTGFSGSSVIIINFFLQHDYQGIADIAAALCPQ
jgi:hypothetical protein